VPIGSYANAAACGAIRKHGKRSALLFTLASVDAELQRRRVRADNPTVRVSPETPVVRGPKAPDGRHHAQRQPSQLRYSQAAACESRLMAARKTFRLRPRRRANGETTWYGRFTDQNGVRREIPLGITPRMDEPAASRALEHIQADVERGVWKPPEPSIRPKVDTDMLLFGDMAYDWWQEKIAGRKSERTQKAYKTELDLHLMPVFEKHRVATITRKDVDKFVSRQLKKGLSPNYVNSQLLRLGQILDLAMKWHPEILPRNPARDKDSRAEVQHDPNEDRWLDPDHVELLLYAARLLDEGQPQMRRHPKTGKVFTIGPRAQYRHLGREAIIGCLCFSGLRATELCDLKWSAVNLDRRTIYVPGTKSKNAGRTVNIVDGLLPLLIGHYNTSPFNRKTDPVFPTAKGTKRNKDNLRERVVAPVDAKARQLILEDERLAGETDEPRRMDVELPPDITPHTFRRTFCGFCTEVERDPNYVQRQMGHAHPAFTQRIYNRVRDWGGVPDARVIAWMDRPEPQARPSRLRLVG
jgi:integrase